jgi:methionyl-tRNA formyltransferase
VSHEPQEARESELQSLKPAPKIFKETCEIDWTKTAKQVYDFVRGLSPYPGAWTTLVDVDGKETVLKVYKTRKTGLPGMGSGVVSVMDRTLCISASDELLEIVELQLAGKKRMAARDFLNGMKNLELYRIK